jgi:hypothetical protein
MNPIHEAGFASVMVLFLLTSPAALSALVALVLSWKRPRGALVAADATFVLGALLCLLAAVTTMKLHTRVDQAIDSGGYGPADAIRRQYGADWHESARLTAWVGLVFSAIPCGIARLVHALVRKKMPDIEKSNGPLVMFGVAALICLVMAII